jgi:hypothetical protein
VQKRLDYIKGELTRVDGQITALEAKATDKQTEVGVPSSACSPSWELLVRT